MPLSETTSAAHYLWAERIAFWHKLPKPDPLCSTITNFLERAREMPALRENVPGMNAANGWATVPFGSRKYRAHTACGTEPGAKAQVAASVVGLQSIVWGTPVN